MFSDNLNNLNYEKKTTNRNFDKKKILFVVVVWLVIGVSCFLIFRKRGNNDKNITFVLNGSSIVDVYINENYVDNGFLVYDSDGTSLRDYVTIDNRVNSMMLGSYEVVYVLKYNNINRSLTRIVNVIEDDLSEYVMTLNGNSTTYVRLNDEYIDLGCNVFDSNSDNSTIDGSETIEGDNYSNEVIVTSNVDTTNVGVYNVNYKFGRNGFFKQIERTVIVYDMKYDILTNPTITTSDNVKIVISFNSPNHAYTILPNGSETSNKKIDYEVMENGEYNFYLYDVYGNVISEKVVVNNIVRDYSCSVLVSNKGSSVSVNGTGISGIYNYTYILDNNEYSSQSNLYSTSYKTLSSAKVRVFGNGYEKEISCSINNDVIYTFKYDENNTKPFMQCGTYTASDRVRLESQLARSIERAGYGTRAGVVEAARYFVGGLDYKVPYLGPKTVNSILGRYSKVGLNIGNDSAWGCTVSDWIQGLDCTNFVTWAFVNGGVKLDGAYSIKDTYKSNSVGDRIRAGDLMLSPCENNSCKSTFQHVGIVIGVDNNYVYVAESTTGKVNAVIVSKWNRYSLPASGKFSVVRLYNYLSDGNYTSMWNR